MRVGLVLALSLALLSLLLLPRVEADEIRLKDGEILYGEVTSRGEHKVEVRVARGNRTLKADVVVEILTAGKPSPALPGLGAGAWRVGNGVQALAAVRWGAGRRHACSSGGVTTSSEAAVKRALAWLAAHQDEDGKLDADGFMKHDPEGSRTDGAGGGHHGERVACGFDGVTTAVALLAWSAAGSTSVSGPYRTNVVRALSYCTGVLAAGARSGYALWNLGWCTQAVVDAYALRPDATLEAPIRTAIAAILRLQRKDGGWSYYLRVGDMPTTGVATSALALAARAGFVVPTDAVAAALRFLDARVDPATGRSEYHDGAERKGYTPTRANAASGLAVRALFGRLSQTKLLAKQIAAIRQRPVWRIEFEEVKTKDGRTVRAQIGNLYPYQWYYATGALYERGGGAWSAWFGALKKALVSRQRRDGAFAGSWDPLGNYSSSAGRVFVTGLCTLMLMTPCRYPRVR